MIRSTEDWALVRMAGGGKCREWLPGEDVTLGVAGGWTERC